MAHKTLIGGTTYEIKGGKTLVGGTGYDVDGGKTLVGGTGYEVSFGTSPEADTLNGCSWANIAQIADEGTGANFWDIGDTKDITLSGTWRTVAVSGVVVSVYIIGFDHNSQHEGAGRIHFKLGKMSGVQVGFIDGKYNTSCTDSSYFCMYTGSGTNVTNSGGWANSNMRKNVLGSNSTPSAPHSKSLMECIPSDLRSVLKQTTKYSDNTGGGSDTASYVTATSDYLWLLSEYEVKGARTYANSAEQNYQKQYDYYKLGNSTIHYSHKVNTYAVIAYMRSVNASAAHAFLTFNTTEGAIAPSYGHCANSRAVAPAFAVGVTA